MIKIIFGVLMVVFVPLHRLPEVKVSGAMKNIMIQGDLSAHINIDTLDKSHLYALGPVAGLKGEILILDGIIYSTSANGKHLHNEQNKASGAAMLVYSQVEKWKLISSKIKMNNYADLEKLIETIAIANDYNTEIPFAFKIETVPIKATYHVIDWNDSIAHTMETHKQFAYSGQADNLPITLVGFFSKHHQSIFTHHTSYTHIHLLEEKTKTVGHLDEIQLNGQLTIYLPEE